MNTKLVTLLLVISTLVSLTLAVFVVSHPQIQQPSDALFQASSLASLVNGSYAGKTTSHDLLNHGDFGLGAVAYMDGELVCLDAKCYQITPDGMTHELSPSSEIAFASVVFFKPDETFAISSPQNFTGLQKYLDDKILPKNDIFAIKIDGFFSDMTARTVHKQDKLYVPLSQVVANQTVFHLSNVRGTLVGFYVPDYLKEVNVARYHFHFLTDNTEYGGHVLDFDMKNGTVYVSKINKVTLVP